jgi:hypothetical protein
MDVGTVFLSFALQRIFLQDFLCSAKVGCETLSGIKCSKEMKIFRTALPESGCQCALSSS